MEFVVSFSVDGEPVESVDLLAPGGELGEEIFLVSPLFDFIAGAPIADVGNGLSVGLNNLKIVIVDPYAPLEISLLAFNLLGRDIEDVAVQFVFLLLANIEDVVFRKILGGQDEWKAVANVGEIFLRHVNLLQARLGRKDDVLDALTLVVKDYVEDFVIFAVDRLAVDGLDLDALAVGVLVAGLGEFRLLRGETLDNLVGSRVLRRSVIERALLSGGRDDRQSADEQSKAEEETNDNLHSFSVSNRGGSRDASGDSLL